MKKVLFVVAMAILSVTSAVAGELLVNGGFESGSLTPWFNARNFCFGTCVPWDVSTANPHTGLFSATDVGNIELLQNFTPTPGANITSVTFWVNSGAGFNAIDFFYTDGSDQEFLVSSTANVWNFEDVTSDVDTSRTLVGFSIFGASPDIVTYFDDASITSSVPEPSSLLMLGGGVVALATALRRKLRA